MTWVDNPRDGFEDEQPLLRGLDEEGRLDVSGGLDEPDDDSEAAREARLAEPGCQI